MNKLGDVPVMFLAIGVFAICGFALLSFTFSLSKSIGSFEAVSLVEKANSAIDIYEFYKKIGMTQVAIENTMGLDRDGYGLHINVSEVVNGNLVTVTYYL